MSFDSLSGHPERGRGVPPDSLSAHAGHVRWARRPVPTLLLLAFLTFFVGLGRQAITDSDEAFYAEAAREMVADGDWLTPHFNFEDRWQKPVLYYWVTAAAFAAAGVTEFGARLGAALAGIGLVLITWSASRRLMGRHDAAWIAGAITATCYGYFAMARSSLPDLPLAFFVTAAVYATLRASDPEQRRAASWWAVAGLSAGLGFLTKGPVALAVPAVILLPIWLRERRRGTVSLRTAHVVVAVILFAISGLPWYVAMSVRHGVPYLQSFFVADNLERFATARFNEPRSILFYVPIVIGGIFPWSAFMLVMPWRTLRDLATRRRTLTVLEWRLLIWTLAPLLLFTASVGKQPRYILPVLPPLAMMLGLGLAHRIEEAQMAAPRRELSIATFTTAGMFMALALLLYRARPLFVSALPPLTGFGILAVLCSALMLGATAAKRNWTRLPLVMAGASTVLLLTWQFGASVGLRPEAVEEMAAMIRANRLGGEPIGEYEAFVRNLVFYTHVRQVPISDDAGALAFLKSPGRVFLVLGKDDLDRLNTLGNAPAHAIGQVTFLNTARVRLRTLLAPLPEQDLETVVLVSNR